MDIQRKRLAVKMATVNESVVFNTAVQSFKLVLLLLTFVLTIEVPLASSQAIATANSATFNNSLLMTVPIELVESKNYTK